MPLLQAKAFFCYTGSFPSSYKHDLVCPISKKTITKTVPWLYFFPAFLFLCFSSKYDCWTYLYTPPFHLLSSSVPIQSGFCLHWNMPEPSILQNPMAIVPDLATSDTVNRGIVPPISVSYSFLLLYWTLKYWSNPGTGLSFSPLPVSLHVISCSPIDSNVICMLMTPKFTSPISSLVLDSYIQLNIFTWLSIAISNSTHRKHVLNASLSPQTCSLPSLSQ